MEQAIQWWPRPPDNSAMQTVVAQRLTEMSANAERHMESINARIIPRHSEFNRRAANLVHSRASTDTRIGQLHKLADDMFGVGPDEAGCRKGCSHCCHIAVAVTWHEARYIGKHTGKTPTPRKQVRHTPSFEGFDYGYHNPCPFLVNNLCSIYEHRPLACRVHVNLDVDELLCRLDPPNGGPVPYMNTIQIQQLMAVIASPDFMFADIRKWFPKAL
jgi:uncharacterized protein